jgi:AbrB family looped-hinge helix DNA binding protein
MTTVTVDNAGRLVLPEDVREAMGLGEGGELDIEVTRGPAGPALVIRHHIPDEDAWAYTDENLAGIARARKEIAAGKLHRMSEADLRKLAQVADDE